MRQERKYNFAKLYLLSHTQLALFTELLKKKFSMLEPKMATIERTLYMRTFNSTIYSQFVKKY